MIFVGDGRAKEGKDTVAQRLGHIALIAMHRLHHELEGRVNDAASVFGIEIFDEGSGVFDVGKESSDGLTLTVGGSSRFQSCLLGPDTLGQVGRSVTRRRLRFGLQKRYRLARR